MPDYVSCYNATGSRCSGMAQPGVRALRDALDDLFPALGDLGIYNCRPSSGGGGLSTHGEGRGWDAACNANTAEGRALGDEIAMLLVKHHRALGIQRIIWNRRQTDVLRGMGDWRSYSGRSPHTDHLHIELCWKSARDVPLTIPYVKQVVGEASDEEEEDLTESERKKLDYVYDAVRISKPGSDDVESIDRYVKRRLDASDKVLAALAKKEGIVVPEGFGT